MPSAVTSHAESDVAQLSLAFPPRRWTVEEFRKLRQADILNEDDRVELLEGWIVEKMTQDPSHARVVQLATKILIRMLPAEWGLRVRLPIETDDSEPEPDLAIVPDADDRYATRHPYGNETALVIEIADTSLLRDRRKAMIYARAGVPEYWIVDLLSRRIERYRVPDQVAGEYKDLQAFEEAEALPVNLGELNVGSIAVRTFLPAS